MSEVLTRASNVQVKEQKDEAVQFKKKLEEVVSGIAKHADDKYL